MPVTLVKSSWSSGSLVFHESASYAPSVTYDVLTIGTGAVKVGNTSNDVDFQYYGTGSLSAIIDCGAATYTLTGISLVADGGIAVTKAITSSTYGTSWTLTTTATSGTSTGAYMSVTGTGVGGSVKGMVIEANANAASTGCNNLYGLEVSSYIDTSKVQKSGGVMTGIYCWVGTGTTPTLNGSVYGMVIDLCLEAVPAQNMYPIYIVNNSAAANATGPVFYVKTKASQLFNLATASSPAWSTTGSLSNQTGWILCSVEGVSRYIPLYSG